MTDQNKDKHIDELLDSMLSAYSAVEPRPGLENRVLAQLREAESSRVPRRWSMKWLWAGAAVTAAAILLLAVWAGSHRAARAPENTIVQIPLHQPQVQPVPPRPQIPRRMPETAAAGAGRHQPGKSATPRVESAALALNQRPSVFPTPTPLSEQEQLMLRYLARTPREELIAQSHADEPPPPAAGDDQSGLGVPNLISVPQKSSNTR